LRAHGDGRVEADGDVESCSLLENGTSLELVYGTRGEGHAKTSNEAKVPGRRDRSGDASTVGVAAIRVST
jgi:hypothetical protein